MPEPVRRIVSNTTPIIALALVGRLGLLQRLYGEVWIQPAVASKIAAGGAWVGVAELQAADYLCTVSLDDLRRADLLSDLDCGEAEAIALAQAQNADLLLIDERLGRRHAQRLGLTVTGTLGVLLRAKREGEISAVGPLLDRLLQGGIRLDQRLVERVLHLADET